MEFFPYSLKQLSYRKFIKEHKRWTFQNYNILQLSTTLLELKDFCIVVSIKRNTLFYFT